MNRLALSTDLEIYFDENDKPKYNSTNGATFKMVQEQIYELQAFLEIWLLEANEPNPPRLSLLQQKVRKQMAPLLRLLRRKLGMSDEVIRTVLQHSIDPLREQYPTLSSEELQTVMDGMCCGESRDTLKA